MSNAELIAWAQDRARTSHGDEAARFRQVEVALNELSNLRRAFSALEEELQAEQMRAKKQRRKETQGVQP